MLVAFLGLVLILQGSLIDGQGTTVYELPGGGKVIVADPSQVSNPRPEHKHRERYPPGFQVIQLGGDNGPKRGDSNSGLLDGIWDYLKHQNGSWNSGSSGVQVIQLGGNNGPKRSSHTDDDDDDDALRKIFKLLRFGSRRGDSHSNIQFFNGRDAGNHGHFAQERSDLDYALASSQKDLPRKRVKIIRQNVPRRMLVRNLRSSQAHLTNMQTLSFPVFEDEWQIA